jgi:hypothetical protein
VKTWVLVVAVLAACKSPAEPPAAVGSAAPHPPADAAAVASSSTLPACKEKATFEMLPPDPIKGSGKLDGNDLLVGSFTGAHYNLSAYDLSTRKWQEMPGVDLGAKEDRTVFSHFLTKRALLLVTQVKGDHWVVRSFDRAAHRWSAPASTPSSPADYLQWIAGETYVLQPYHCSQHPERTLLFKGNRFESVPTTFTLRSHPTIQVVAGKLVMWGGPANGAPPPKADADCKYGSEHAADGVVLDPATATWTPMASGPPALTELGGFSAGDDLFVYGRAGAQLVLWRYDLGKNVWNPLGVLPPGLADRDFFSPNDTAQAGSTVVLNHGGNAAAQVAINIETGTVRPGKGLPITPAALVAIDKTHLLMIPQSPVPATATAYIEDLDTHTWCELPWIDRAPFYEHDKPTFVGVAKLVGDKLLVWKDGPGASGYLASFQ